MTDRKWPSENPISKLLGAFNHCLLVCIAIPINHASDGLKNAERIKMRVPRAFGVWLKQKLLGSDQFPLVPVNVEFDFVDFTDTILVTGDDILNTVL
jgi:hypothetical protein